MGIGLRVIRAGVAGSLTVSPVRFRQDARDGAMPRDRVRSVRLTTVVLPAPLEPSRAETMPGATSRSTPLSTLRSPYDFRSPAIRMAGVVLMRPA